MCAETKIKGEGENNEPSRKKSTLRLMPRVLLSVMGK